MLPQIQFGSRAGKFVGTSCSEGYLKTFPKKIRLEIFPVKWRTFAQIFQTKMPTRAKL